MKSRVDNNVIAFSSLYIFHFNHGTDSREYFVAWFLSKLVNLVASANVYVWFDSLCFKLGFSKSPFLDTLYGKIMN